MTALDLAHLRRLEARAERLIATLDALHEALERWYAEESAAGRDWTKRADSA